MFNFTVSKIEQSFKESLENLQLPYVDLIQVHDVEFSQSIDQIVNKVLPTLQGFKKAGKVRYIGITGYNLGVLKNIVKRSPPGTIDTVLSYGRCNMIDQGTFKTYLRCNSKAYVDIFFSQLQWKMSCYRTKSKQSNIVFQKVQVILQTFQIYWTIWISSNNETSE